MRLAFAAVLPLLFVFPLTAAQTGTIRVMATAEVDMPPDGARLNVTLQADDGQEAVARQRAEAQAADIEQAIRALNVPGLSIGARDVSAQPYWMSNGYKLFHSSYARDPGKPSGFMASAKIAAVVEHRDGKARELLRPVWLALSERKLYPTVTYTWDDTSKWARAAIVSATAKAMDAAQAIAKAGGVRITAFEYFGFTAPGQRAKPEEIGPRIVIPSGNASGKAVCTIWAVAVY